MELNLDVLRYDLAMLYAKVKFESALKDDGRSGYNPLNASADGHLDMQFTMELEALITAFGRSFKELSLISDDGLLKKMHLIEEDAQSCSEESPLPF